MPAEVLVKRRAVVEVLTALKEPESRPAVTISRVSGGEITYSVKASGRSVKKAAEAAMAAYREVATFALTMKNGQTVKEPEKSVEGLKR